jgi:GTP-binding protein Era
MTRAGFVAVVGKPNAGKSTLLNRLVGQKLAITSPKPQSTRDRVVGIVTRPEYQMVLLDTPGLLNPKYALQEAMKATAVHAVEEADVIVYLVDGAEGTPVSLVEAAGLDRTPKARVITAVNKLDLIDDPAREAFQASIPDVVFFSALTGEGVPELEKEIVRSLPESPYLYPEDELSTQTVRFFVSEMIRETTLELLHEEIPYSIACEVEEYREGRSPHFIRAVIYVERESQKGIVVGARGAMIKKIGENSRKKIESFVGEKVYLELQVKVLENWRKKPGSLERFGYHIRKGPKK